MRKLTLYPRMGDSNIKHIESIIGSVLPEDFKCFLKENAGLSHYERYFFDWEDTQWEVKKYLTYPELFKLEEEKRRQKSKVGKSARPPKSNGGIRFVHMSYIRTKW
jgi:hypothetical protein